MADELVPCVGMNRGDSPEGCSALGAGADVGCWLRRRRRRRRWWWVGGNAKEVGGRRLGASHRLSRGAGGDGDDLKRESCCVGWGVGQCQSACEVHAFFNFVVEDDDAGIIIMDCESGNRLSKFWGFQRRIGSKFEPCSQCVF
jgi:hypothetical protein